ncbi:hypothetical protein PSHT_15244 [Puccinia striiformis]|uniref:malate synthase n=1 Tax=Puccinia striiformis TaxID=27350 RepID=A0A2S4UFX4_9BASI|nr:hypothetical protein PSHT_15244 [Puccinia striiformis]
MRPLSRARAEDDHYQFMTSSDREHTRAQILYFKRKNGQARYRTPPGVTITCPVESQHQAILTPEALKFLATLHRYFEPTRRSLLQRRQLEQARLDAGGLPNFHSETKWVRDNLTWQAASPAPGLRDRRVEITGPVDRKMVINALNSGAATFMADFEDSHAPTWLNNLDGQINMKDAVRRQISFKAPNGKDYKLNDRIATLIVRARGWHLDEPHLLVDGQPISGGIFDFGLYFFHNAQESIKRGFGPYFYLPKMEHYLEARLWNDIFKVAQDYIHLPRGTIRATCLIETIPAAFQMDEFIFELKEHSAGLNCGRWDLPLGKFERVQIDIFSFIKKMRHNPQFVLPDRSDVTMTVPFMDAYVSVNQDLPFERRCCYGGDECTNSDQDNPKANEAAMNKVKADKLREVKAGHDGTWVAHPALVKVALDIFNEHMVGPNQYHVRRSEVQVTALDLLNTNVPGKITEHGIRENVSAALQYCANWITGVGCVPIANLMEDAATAEIARLQIWQWLDMKVTAEWIDQILEEETVQAKKTTAKGLDPAKVDIAKRY